MLYNIVYEYNCVTKLEVTMEQRMKDNLVMRTPVTLYQKETGKTGSQLVEWPDAEDPWAIHQMFSDWFLETNSNAGSIKILTINQVATIKLLN